MNTSQSDNDFNKIWLSFSLSLFGDGINRAATPMIVYFLTKDVASAGVSIAVSRLPWLMASQQIGSLTDKIRATIIFRAGIAMKLIGLLIAFYILNSSTRYQNIYYILIFIISTGELTSEISSQKYICIAFSANQLTSLNSKIYFSQILIGQILCQMASTVLLTFSAQTTVIFCAIIQLLSTASTFQIKSYTNPVSVKNQTKFGTLETFRGFWKIINETKPLYGLSAINFIMMLTYGMWTSAFVVYYNEIFPNESERIYYGFLISAVGVGSLSGILIFNIFKKKINTYQWILITCVGLFFLPFTGVFGKNIFFIYFILFIYGSSLSGWNIAVVSYRQKITPEIFLGRFSGVYKMLSWGAIPIGSACNAVLINRVGAVGIFEICFATACSQVIFLPKLKEMKLIYHE